MIQKLKYVVPLIAALVPSIVLAHVTIKPSQVGVGSFQTFSVSVPSEKEFATTQVRLIVPEGLEHVSPTVKPGWRIDLKKEGSGEEAVVKEITWRGGQIPGHYRDDFTFSAKVPSTESKLVWKAYQTYSDGSVVSWELEPGTEQPKNHDGEADFSKQGPASVTAVIDDLSGSEESREWPVNPRLLLFLSLISLAISLLTLIMGLASKKRRK